MEFGDLRQRDGYLPSSDPFMANSFAPQTQKPKLMSKGAPAKPGLPATIALVIGSVMILYAVYSIVSLESAELINLEKSSHGGLPVIDLHRNPSRFTMEELEGRLVYARGMIVCREDLHDWQFGISQNGILMRRHVNMAAWHEECSNVGRSDQNCIYEVKWTGAAPQNSVDFRDPKAKNTRINPAKQYFDTSFECRNALFIGDVQIGDNMWWTALQGNEWQPVPLAAIKYNELIGKWKIDPEDANRLVRRETDGALTAGDTRSSWTYLPGSVPATALGVIHDGRIQRHGNFHPDFPTSSVLHLSRMHFSSRPLEEIYPEGYWLADPGMLNRERAIAIAVGIVGILIGATMTAVDLHVVPILGDQLELGPLLFAIIDGLCMIMTVEAYCYSKHMPTLAFSGLVVALVIMGATASKGRSMRMENDPRFQAQVGDEDWLTAGKRNL